MMNSTQGDLRLRPVTIEDKEQFFELIDRNRLRLRDYFPGTMAEVTSIENCSRYLEDKLAKIGKKELYCFVLEGAGVLHGLYFLKNVNWTVPKCELAYFVDEELQGKGIMSWAMAEVIKYCLDTLQMNKLFIMTAMDNNRSRKLAKRNGFELEGVIRKDFKLSDGTLVDMGYYGLVR